MDGGIFCPAPFYVGIRSGCTHVLQLSTRVEGPTPQQLAKMERFMAWRFNKWSPGTGKTYALTRLLKREYEQPMASVSPQEWRNQIIAEKIAVLKWWEGAAAALYDLGGKAKVPELAEHPFIQAITAAKGRADGIKQTLWGALCNITRFLNQPALVQI